MPFCCCKPPTSAIDCRSPLIRFFFHLEMPASRLFKMTIKFSLTQNFRSAYRWITVSISAGCVSADTHCHGNSNVDIVMAPTGWSVHQKTYISRGREYTVLNAYFSSIIIYIFIVYLCCNTRFYVKKKEEERNHLVSEMRLENISFGHLKT